MSGWITAIFKFDKLKFPRRILLINDVLSISFGTLISLEADELPIDSMPVMSKDDPEDNITAIGRHRSDIVASKYMRSEIRGLPIRYYSLIVCNLPSHPMINVDIFVPSGRLIFFCNQPTKIFELFYVCDYNQTLYWLNQQWHGTCSCRL